MTTIPNENEEIEFKEKERDYELSKPIFISPEPEGEYDDGQGRRYDILDDEIA